MGVKSKGEIPTFDVPPINAIKLHAVVMWRIVSDGKTRACAVSRGVCTKLKTREGEIVLLEPDPDAKGMHIHHRAVLALLLVIGITTVAEAKRATPPTFYRFSCRKQALAH
jgi:hypothetical protein